MTPTCINLAERFGGRYRIGHDEAAESRNDPWGMVMPCRFGTIYPYDGDMLALDIDYHPGAARKVAAIPGVRVHQDGGWGGEMTFTFNVTLFDAVAAIVRPKRLPGPRRLSDEHKAKLARYQFQPRCSERLSKARTGQTASKVTNEPSEAVCAATARSE